MSLQLLTGTHVSGSGAPIAGRTVSAKPVPGQYIDALTIDTAAIVTTALTDEDGAWSLTLVGGVIYDVKIEKWGFKTIRVTDDAEKEFVTYLDDSAVLAAGPKIGSIKVGNRYVMPTLTDESGQPVDVANIQTLEGLTLGWEIV